MQILENFAATSLFFPNIIEASSEANATSLGKIFLFSKY
jgi:hypothetical protein